MDEFEDDGKYPAAKAFVAKGGKARDAKLTAHTAVRRSLGKLRVAGGGIEYLSLC